MLSVRHPPSFGEIEHLSLSERREEFEISNKKLGIGGFGSVSKATRTKTGKHYAFKSCPRRVDDDPDQEINIINEIKVHCGLKHKYIVRMIGYIEEKSSIVMVMDYVSNGDLSKLIHNPKPISPRLIARIVYQTASALTYLHSQSIIHRDIKPANLLMDDNFHVRVADFGLSVANVTGRRSTMCGTLQYMAPELYDRHPKYDESVDVWSLGIVLYESLTKRHPFGGYSVPQIRLAIRSGNFSIPSQVPIDAADLLRRLLILDPNQRMALKEVMDHEFVTQYGKSKNKSGDRVPSTAVAESSQPSPCDLEVKPPIGIPKSDMQQQSENKSTDDVERVDISVTVVLVHSNSSIVISKIDSWDSFYSNIMDGFSMTKEEFAFLTVNTEKRDLARLFCGKLKNTDVIYVHKKKKERKKIKIVRKDTDWNVVFADNGFSGPIVKSCPATSELKPGDFVEEIGDIHLKGKSLFEVSRILHEFPVNSKISLAVSRSKQKKGKLEMIRKLLGADKTQSPVTTFSFKENGRLIVVSATESSKEAEDVNQLFFTYFSVDDIRLAEQTWDAIKASTNKTELECCLQESPLSGNKIPEKLLDRLLAIVTASNEKLLKEK